MIRKDLWSCKKVGDVWYVTCRSDLCQMIGSSCIGEKPSLADIKHAVREINNMLVEEYCS